MIRSGDSSTALRALIKAHQDEIEKVLNRYHATNPRVFGSVARGEAGPDSDIDLLVDLDPKDGNILFRAGGLSEELQAILGRKVDVFSTQLMKGHIAEAALADALSL